MRSSNESHQFLSISRELPVENNLLFNPAIALGLEKGKHLYKTPDQNFESNDGAGHKLNNALREIVNELFMEAFLPLKTQLMFLLVIDFQIILCPKRQILLT